MYQNGRAFTSRRWKTSSTIARVKTFPQSALVYSNDPSIIYVNTGRPALRLPRKYDKKHSRDRSAPKLSEKYFSELKEMKERLVLKEGYIVFFGKRDRWFQIPRSEFQKRLPIQIMEELSDGVIYQIRPD
jgi:hypothetical protein